MSLQGAYFATTPPRLGAAGSNLLLHSSPGLMIFITILSVNYIGDGLRDAFNPYKVLETVGEYT